MAAPNLRQVDIGCSPDVEQTAQPEFAEPVHAVADVSQPDLAAIGYSAQNSVLRASAWVPEATELRPWFHGRNALVGNSVL